MASWLRAAEDLFEVVDKRAKSVVGENSDEQPNARESEHSCLRNETSCSWPQMLSFCGPLKRSNSEKATSWQGISQSDFEIKLHSNEKGSQTKRSRQKKKKPQNDYASNESSETVNFERAQNSQGMSQSDFSSDKDKAILLTEYSRTNPGSPSVKTSTEDKLKVSEDGASLDAPISETASNNELNHHADHVESAEPIDVKVVSSESTGEHISGNTSDIPGEIPLLPAANLVDTVQDKSPVDSDQNTVLLDTGSPVNFQQERPKSLTADEPEDRHFTFHEDESKLKLPDMDNWEATLRDRMFALDFHPSSRSIKSENAQLEELLCCRGEYGHLILEPKKRGVEGGVPIWLRLLLQESKEIEALIVSSTDALKKQAALLEGNLASLQANMESLMRNRELTETRMMQALREELGAAERRSEEERAAHNATKKAFMEREVELEHRALEASTALARAQNAADERTAKATELEQKVALLEMQAWQEEVERARQGQREAESKLASLEAEMQKLRVETAAMKRDAEHYSRQEHVELEKRYRELTDLLYYKQTQLEAMASEKAAAEFQLEKEAKRLQEVQLEAERNRASRRASSSWEEDTDIKALEASPFASPPHGRGDGTVTEGSEASGLGGCQGNTISLALSNCSSYLAFLSGICPFVLDVSLFLQEQADTFASKRSCNRWGSSANLTMSHPAETIPGSLCSAELLDKAKFHLSTSSIVESQKCMNRNTAFGLFSA
ncbi:hypothetical protein HAX54_053488 [Datura stramonium]|uniref:Golgin candidate 1 n=1 Tax=Datura stramonium TaxID=4076 RepID=A0ABS8T1G9_DATST|nr:hypothetical protein [Datura stramonium]